MKIANLAGRAVLVLGDEVADIATVSDGRFGPDPMDIYGNWTGVCELGASIFTGTPGGVGLLRQPSRFLEPGTTLETTIDGIGTMRNRIVAGR